MVYEHGISEPLQIHALGTLLITRHGSALQLVEGTSRRAMQLLMALIAAGPGGLAKHVVCQALWPDSEGDAGCRSLITTVYRLRRLLGLFDAVCAGGRKVCLNPAACRIDAWQFQCAVSVAGATSAAELADAVSRYGGPLLKEDDSPFVREMRERLRHRFERAVLQLVAFELQRGSVLQAVERYERALEVDDACESLHRGLIQCLVRLDQATQAEQALKRCRMALMRHFAAPPSPATVRALSPVNCLAAARRAGPPVTDPSTACYA